MRKFLLIICSVCLLASSCNSQAPSHYSNSSSKIIIENPYSSGSGHYAGYEWAQKTGGNCSGNSQSFNEGCAEYYNQINNQK